jgi:hypothetical protein
MSAGSISLDSAFKFVLLKKNMALENIMICVQKSTCFLDFVHMFSSQYDENTLHLFLSLLHFTQYGKHIPYTAIYLHFFANNICIVIGTHSHIHQNSLF